jgi:hypothetical protein
VFSASFDSFLIEGINLDDALTSKTLDFKRIKLSRPAIIIHRKKAAPKTQAEKEDFSQRFLKEMEKLSVNQLQIDNGTIMVYNDVKKGPPLKLSRVAVDMSNILLDSATRLDKERFLFAKEATLSVEDYRRPTPDGLYEIRLGKAEVTAHKRQVKLRNFSFASPLSRQAFTKKQTQAKELYNVQLPSITISGVNWWDLLNEEEIAASEITTSGGKLSIFLDRTLPPKNKMGNFPSQLLMKVPLKLNIAKFLLKDLQFSYAEFNPLSGGTGTVSMDNVKLDISNLSNQTPNRPVIIDGSAMFMGTVPLQAQFSFDLLKHKTGAFTAFLKTGGFDATLINAFAEPVGLMKMEKGKLLGIQASMTGDQWKSKGTVFIPYEDLNLSLMEKEPGKKRLDKKDVTSFLANALVLKNNNPKEGKKSRRETAEFTRIPEGGFFMLVWKTVLVGALRTMGAPEKIAYKTAGSAHKK